MLIGGVALKPSCLLARLSAFLYVNFNLEHSIPSYDKAELKPAGAETDVYSAAYCLIAVITIASSIMLSFTESDETMRQKPLWGFSTWSKYINQQGKASGIWLHSQPWVVVAAGEERQKQKEPAGRRQ